MKGKQITTPFFVSQHNPTPPPPISYDDNHSSFLVLFLTTFSLSDIYLLEEPKLDLRPFSLCKYF